MLFTAAYLLCRARLLTRFVTTSYSNKNWLISTDAIRYHLACRSGAGLLLHVAYLSRWTFSVSFCWLKQAFHPMVLDSHFLDRDFWHLWPICLESIVIHYLLTVHHEMPIYWRPSLSIGLAVLTLRAKLSGVVYCYRSCLWRAGGVCLWICYHDNSKLRASIFTKLGL